MNYTLKSFTSIKVWSLQVHQFQTPTGNMKFKSITINLICYELRLFNYIIYWHQPACNTILFNSLLSHSVGYHHANSLSQLKAKMEKVKSISCWFPFRHERQWGRRIRKVGRKKKVRILETGNERLRLILNISSQQFPLKLLNNTSQVLTKITGTCHLSIHTLKWIIYKSEMANNNSFSILKPPKFLYNLERNRRKKKNTF